MPKKDTKRLFKRGRTWWVKFIREGKLVRITTGETSLDEAIKRRDEILAPLRHTDKAAAIASLQGQIDYHLELARRVEAENKPGIPAAQLWARWTATAPTASPATMRQYEVQISRFGRWLDSAYPRTTADNVTPEIAAAFVRHMETEKRSANTINKYVMLLRQVWDAIMPEGLANPWSKIAKRTGESISRRPVTQDELAAVLSHADQEMRVLILLGALLALRLGDAATLRWQAVDMKRGVIMLTPRKTSRNTGKMLTLPIVGALTGALEELPGMKKSTYVLPRIASDYLRNATYVTDRLQNLFTACGISTTTERRTKGRRAVEVGFHSLRHYCATMLSNANIPAATAQAILGHSSPALLRTYQHVGSDQIDAALVKVARRLKISPA